MKACEILKKAMSGKKELRIKLLGDSITHGVGGSGFEQNGKQIVGNFARNPQGCCWANKFERFMREEYGIQVINNACTGTNIEFIIKYFDILVEPEDDLVFCMIGTNNRNRYFEYGDKPTREELGSEFYNNLIKLGEMLTAAGKTFIFMANIPASAENERDGENYWRVLHMDDINAIYKAAAEKKGFPLISLYELFCGYCRETDTPVDTLLCDGLHPNDEGYELMYALLKGELDI